MMKRFAKLMVVLALTGCPANTHAPIHATPEGLTGAGRLEAMLSIHAHYLWPSGRFPSGIRTISLHDAAEYLARDAEKGNRAAWSRRRRAIAELAAVGLEEREFAAAIRRLGVDPDVIRRALEVGGKRRALTVSEKESIVADLPEVAGHGDDCAAGWKELSVTVSPPSSPVASYSAKITVPVEVGRVASALDGQSWDHCSKFYCPPEHTYLAHLDASGQPVMDPPVLPHGSVYPGTTLFEHFQCPIQECGYATFENLLNVDAQSSGPPTHYQVTYGLRKYLSGTASGFGPGDLEIGIDGGQLWVEPNAAGNGSVVYADKTLWFHNPVMTGLFNGGLQLMEKELAGELAEIACCAITDPPPTQCPP